MNLLTLLWLTLCIFFSFELHSFMDNQTRPDLSWWWFPFSSFFVNFMFCFKWQSKLSWYLSLFNFILNHHFLSYHIMHLCQLHTIYGKPVSANIAIGIKLVGIKLVAISCFTMSFKRIGQCLTWRIHEDFLYQKFMAVYQIFCSRYCNRFYGFIFCVYRYIKLCVFCS